MNTHATGKVLSRLDEWQARGGTLPIQLRFYRDVLRYESSFRPHVTEPRRSLGTEAASRRLSQGFPLLTSDDLDIDWALLPDRFNGTARIFALYPQLFGELPAILLERTLPVLWLRRATEAWFSGDRLPEIEAGDTFGEGLIENILQNCLRPFLAWHCNALLPLVDQQQWRRGYCPVCGGNTDLSWLDKESGGRWLLCSRCDGQWLFQRLQCPFCDTTRQDALSYLTDEKGLYRLYLCDNCKSYLKAVDLRSADDHVLLPLERILTLAYDVQALSEGYVAGDRKVALKEVARA